jgi:hypothetical protein
MEESTQSHAGIEQILSEMVANLRNNPKKYEGFRKALKAAKSEQDVAKELMHFATNEKDLAALIPARARGTAPVLASWTITVTIVTVMSHD